MKFVDKLVADSLRRLENEAHRRERKRDGRLSPKTLEDLAEAVYLGQLNGGMKTLLESEFSTHKPSEVFDMIMKCLRSEADRGTVHQFGVEPQVDEGDRTAYPILRVACVSDIAVDLEVFLRDRVPYFGWYVGFAHKQLFPVDGEIVLLQEYLVEPRFPNSDEDVARNTESVIAGTSVFYHVTREKFAPKIEKYGLIPSKTKRKEKEVPGQKLVKFEYPDRIYLFTDQDAAVEYAERNLVPNSRDGYLEQTKEINRRYIGNKSGPDEKVEADAVYQKPDAGMVFFTVDLRKLIEDGRRIHLYHDNRFGVPGLAYFTMDPIPPKYIRRGGSMGIPPNLV